LEHNGPGKIVFVKEPSVGTRSQNGNVAMASSADRWYHGTDLYTLSPISPTGTLTNLTSQWTRSSDNEGDWGSAINPEVSFDGTKILFAMTKAKEKGKEFRPFALYEMNVDGSNLVQLTNPDLSSNPGDDIDPAYIDDNHIVFASNRNHIADEYERREATQLFIGERGGADGGLVNIRQVTFNQSHDQKPFVQSSGKILFTHWDHLGGPNKMPLFTMNADGTGQFVAYGADETFGDGMTSGSRTFIDARELHDGGIITSVMERPSVFEGGAIGIIDLSKFTSPPQIITPTSSPYNTTQKASDALFRTPYPIMDGTKERILVAQSAHEAGRDVANEYVNYDLFIMDKDGGNLKLVNADPKNNDYDPVVVAPRSLPHTNFALNASVSEGLKSGATTGKFFDANVYSRMDNDGHMSAKELLKGGSDPAQGMAKFVRVIEAVPVQRYNGFDPALGRTEFEKQRVIGYGDVRPDGSLSIEVPANKPLHLQTLDENGLMLVNQLQWINVMPGEQRMCTGCHGLRNKDKEIEFFKNTGGEVTFSLEPTKKYFSNFNNAQKVTDHLSAKKDTVDFINFAFPNKTSTVQNILDRKCTSCHSIANAKDSGKGLVLQDSPDTSLNNHGSSSVYSRLTSDGGYATAKSGTSRRYVSPEGARESPVAWVLFNKQLDGGSDEYRKTSYDHTALWAKDSTGHVNVFAKENVDLLTLVEWMDLGTQYTNTNGAHTQQELADAKRNHYNN